MCMCVCGRKCVRIPCSPCAVLNADTGLTEVYSKGNINHVHPCSRKAAQNRGHVDHVNPLFVQNMLKTRDMLIILNMLIVLWTPRVEIPNPIDSHDQHFPCLKSFWPEKVFSMADVNQVKSLSERLLKTWENVDHVDPSPKNHD